MTKQYVIPHTDSETIMKNNLMHIAVTLALAACCGNFPAYASEADLLQRLDKLSQELDTLKAELKKMQDERKSQVAMPVVTPVAAPAAVTLMPPASISPSTSAAANALPSLVAGQTTLFGYGEINYNRPRNDSSQTQADLRRAVIGIGHRFDDRTEMGMEVEFEHAVTSASDRGETEVEQMWIDHRLNDNVAVRGGLFLIPSGFLNERHEPPTFYGVERNFVETAIIPTTWREGGAMLRGNTLDNALTWNAGVTTGFDLTKWDAASSEGRDSPLRSIHQELQFAKAKDLSILGAVNYRPTLGLTFGGSFFTGKAGQGAPNFPAPDSRITLWETHARWTPARWDLSALYAKGTISDTAAFNQTLVGQLTLVPSAFFGWYTQAAYRLWSEGNYALFPFVRYERFNTASSFADIGAGLTPDAAPTETVTTAGATFRINKYVVVKADYQKFKVDSSRDRFNLGLGFMY